MNVYMESVSEDGYVKSFTVTGSRMVYYDRGSGVPIVLVHGMFGDHLDWAPVLEPLAEHFRVISIDLPGFGDSDKSAASYNVEYFVEALQAFFTELDLREVVLVGNSFGGVLCTLYAATHRDRLRALVLVSSAGMREYSADEQALVDQHFSEKNLLALRPEYIEPMFAMNFARLSADRAAYLERQRGKLSRHDYAAYARVLTECAKLAFAVPVVPLLSRLHLPVLLLWGDSDPVFPLELARSGLKEIPEGRLAVIAGASHMPQMDQPPEFVRTVEEFILGLSMGKESSEK